MRRPIYGRSASLRRPPSTAGRCERSGSSARLECTTRGRLRWSMAPPRRCHAPCETIVSPTETTMAELKDNAPDVVPDSEALGADAQDPQAAAVETLQREKDALQDRLLRTAAEFDNYRKRMERERRELSEYAAGEVLKDLLPVIDNFERALQAPATPETDALRKGIELIHKQMLDVLNKRGVRPIEALGADFDPNLHQAVIH